MGELCYPHRGANHLVEGAGRGLCEYDGIIYCGKIHLRQSGWMACWGRGSVSIRREKFWSCQSCPSTESTSNDHHPAMGEIFWHGSKVPMH